MSLAALTPLLGIAVLVGFALLLSENRKAIRVRTVAGAFAIQLALGAFVLATPIGKDVLLWLSDIVNHLITAAYAGIEFLFGYLADKNAGFIFVIRVLPIIIFFSAFIAVLYHLRIMQLVVRFLGGGLRLALGTSRTESLSAAANIFVGQTEAPLVVRPYIAKMTRSELFAVMCGGLASIAGSVLAAYAEIGVELKYLIAASFMAAPGGLLFAKIILPETTTPDESPVEPESDDEKPANVFDAAALGASAGLKLALNVGAMLLAFIALIALLNLILGGVGGWFGHPNLSLQLILGYLFRPLAWLLGIPWNEAIHGGSFIGQKIVVNEFVAYLNFVELKDTLSPRTQGIITFALCGFANFSSIAILLGGLGGMAPSRRPEIARLGLKAVAAATLANLTSAAIAALFISTS
ncbi:MAG: NupC/NupG family nucleoside CNT transporter [Verrucomicrobiota bacterium]